MRLKELLHHLYLGVHRSPDLGDVEERGWVLVPPGPQLLQRAQPRDEEVPGGAQQPGPEIGLVNIMSYNNCVGVPISRLHTVGSMSV